MRSIRAHKGEPLNSVNIFNDLPGEYFDPIVGFELISSSAFGSVASCAGLMVTLPPGFNPNRFGLWLIGEGPEEEEEASYG
jgi:hypothetical protein